jgi:hypothetical protein
MTAAASVRAAPAADEGAATATPRATIERIFLAFKEADSR